MELVLNTQVFFNVLVEKPKSFFGDFFVHLKDHFIPHARNNYHPHIFSSRMTGLFATLLVTAKIFSLSVLTLSPALPALSSAITAENIVSLTNQSRKDYGLGRLEENSLLSKAAQIKAQDMAEKNYFAHSSPDGRQPWDFIKDAGYGYLMAGENLAVNFSGAENLESAWMNSSSHKANILNKNFEDIGIGIAVGEYLGRTSVYVVQMFGVPATEKIVLKSESTQVEQVAVPAPQTALSQDNNLLEVFDTQTKLEGNALVLTATVASEATKVLAVYGQRASFMYPQSDGTWQTRLSLAELTASGAKLSVKVFDINDNQIQIPIAGFVQTTALNYNLSGGQVAGKQVSVFGNNIDINNFEKQFYLIFAAVILSGLVLAIAIKRHVQHLSLVANGSFLVILAIFMWMG